MEKPAKKRRRFFQFSLATFLIVVTVIAVWLGYIVNRARNQQLAVAMVLSKAGQKFVGYDYQRDPNSKFNLYEWSGMEDVIGCGHDLQREPPGPKWLRELVGEHYLQRLDCVRLADMASPINDHELEVLCQVPTICWLYIQNADITDDGLAHLRNLKKLRILGLANRGAPITDDGLEHLSGLTELEWLFFGRTNITDEGLKHLRRLTKLKHLGLLQVPASDGKITDAGLLQLKPCKALQFLILGTKAKGEGRLYRLKELPNVLIHLITTTD